MSLARTLLTRSPAKVTYNGGTFFTRDDIVTPLDPEWGEVVTSMRGVIDHVATDNIFKVGLRLWGAWENLGIIFPSVYTTPYMGASLSGGGTDLPLVVHGKNGDMITYKHGVITKLADLYLGIDAEIFAADLEITCMIGNNLNPEDNGAYYTIATAQAYTDSFVKTNYKQQRYAAAWGTQTGFTAFQAKLGWKIGFEAVVEKDYSANVGTVDYTLQGFHTSAMCIPVENSMANSAAAQGVQGNVLGRLRSGGTIDTSKDLVITGSGFSATLHKMALEKADLRWGGRPLRNGEHVWKSFDLGDGDTPGARILMV